MINRVYINPPIPVGSRQQTTVKKPQSGQSFNDILTEKTKQTQSQGVKFSAHASNRLIQRNIALNQNDLSRLSDAVDQVKAKGGKDSLIVMDNVSYLVNVPNRTVVTALDNHGQSGNVFTNIDSALFVS